ncbi:hypothetical protein NAI64_05795 [Oxalobacter sp. OxGP1]|uniref:hypothetical protein n=1 Tax=Oxalobacter paeniformigenes TaxID=2946594 RepID=UPI0022AE81DD|nr:hypothetical protein [Oxalobacter paeniformigenes]MCZ4053238.1 hypothetical protein [Oxalobacter paeniformigenes]
MTVESIARKAGPYEFTEGASYPFYFKIFEKTDVYVVVTDDTGVETTIEADTDYRVVMNENQDSDAGGYVTLLKDYTGSKITIGSQVPYDQGVNITSKGGFYPSTLNKAYDKLTILCQQLLEQVSRCIKVNISSGVSADEYKDELEGLVNQSVSSAASAAASAQQAATDSAQAVSDSATALSRSTTALTQSGTALSQSTTALSQSTDAVNSIQPALSAAQQASNDAAEAVTKSEQALAETAAIDSKVEQAVNDAISGVIIPGLSKETITGALGYVPYDGQTNSNDFATNAEVAEAIAAIPGLSKETITGALGYVPYDGQTNSNDFATNAEVAEAIAAIPELTAETIESALGYIPYDAEANSKDFATEPEVSQAIQQAVDAIPEQVNADWNATEGAAAILNKPVLSAIATSGNYADLAGKPATAGMQVFTENGTFTVPEGVTELAVYIIGGSGGGTGGYAW